MSDAFQPEDAMQEWQTQFMLKPNSRKAAQVAAVWNIVWEMRYTLDRLGASGEDTLQMLASIEPHLPRGLVFSICLTVDLLDRVFETPGAMDPLAFFALRAWANGSCARLRRVPNSSQHRVRPGLRG